MSDEFDWTPWLEADEQIVWQGKPSMIQLLFPALVILSAMGYIIWLGLHDPTLKIQLAAPIALIAFPLLAFLLIIAVLGARRTDYAITNLRVLHMGRSIWGKQRFVEIDINKAKVKDHRQISIHGETSKEYFSMLLSKSDESIVLAHLKGKVAMLNGQSQRSTQ